MIVSIQSELGLTLQVGDHQFVKASLAVRKEVDAASDIATEEEALHAFVQDTLIKRICELAARAEMEGLV